MAKLCSVLPVTTCTAERSFLTLCRLKAYLDQIYHDVKNDLAYDIAILHDVHKTLCVEVVYKPRLSGP